MSTRTTMASRGASAYSMAFNLSNTILGSGMLGLPAAFVAWGLTLGTAALVTFGAAAGFTLHLLSECADEVGRPSGFYVRMPSSNAPGAALSQSVTHQNCDCRRSLNAQQRIWVWSSTLPSLSNALGCPPRT